MKTLQQTVILVITLLISSCGSYVNDMHRQFDKADSKRLGSRRRDHFAMYRKSSQKRFFSGKNKKRLSTNDMRKLSPRVKRKYVPDKVVRRRYKADDLNDDAYDGSLWSTENRNSFLFTSDKSKREGDIILILVKDKLKKEISMELKRALPDPVPAAKKSAGAANAAPETPAAPTTPAAAPATPEEGTGPDKVHDKISSIVIEQIGSDHLLLRGRKYLIYKKRKRLIDIQLLVSRREISDEDTVDSNKILEQTINVLE